MIISIFKPTFVTIYISRWIGHNIGHINVNKGSFLKDIDLFDNVEFGVSSADAHAMAPVTRKLIENSFLALLDSGIDYRAKKVGCYTSGNTIDLTNVADAVSLAKLPLSNLILTSIAPCRTSTTWALYLRQLHQW